jgi:thymidine phosphorylase
MNGRLSAAPQAFSTQNVVFIPERALTHRLCQMNPVDTCRPRLKIRGVNLDTGRENVVVISRQSKALRAEIFRGFGRVELRRDSKVLLATVLITDDDAMVGP